MFVFMTIQGLQSVNFTNQASVIFVDPVTLSTNTTSTYYVKNSTQTYTTSLDSFTD